jgi:predicted membrane protein
MDFRNLQLMNVIRMVSRVVTLLFLVALIWAIYQSVVNNNLLPVWAWLGIVVLFAVAIGLLVAVVIYRAVAQQVGPFDFSPSGRLAGQLKNEAQRMAANGANSLYAEIRMMAGVLQVTGGATGVMDAGFTYDDADWRPPVVDYAVDAEGHGQLMVKQKATGRPAMRQGRCEWVIRLNQNLPSELNVKFGAGKADLKLSGLALDRLRVESGVGELALDLSGEWGRSLEAFIKAGIGDTLLRLPQNAGVRVRSTVGLGSIQPQHLAWDGAAYTNALYGQAAVTLDIAVEGAMGKIKLEVTDG